MAHRAADSDGPRRGATFSIVLPLRAVEEIPAEPEPPAGTLVRHDPLRGVCVAVVDDDDDARDRVRGVLERSGASVGTAASAGEALHLLATRRFDVLVADLGMPEQNGLALVRVLRGLPSGSMNRDIPAVAVTAYAARDQEALASGFSVQMGKPVNAELLITTIADLVGPEAAR